MGVITLGRHESEKQAGWHKYAAKAWQGLPKNSSLLVRLSKINDLQCLSRRQVELYTRLFDPLWDKCTLVYGNVMKNEAVR